MMARALFSVVALVVALFVPAVANAALQVRPVDGPSGTEVWLSEEHSLPMIAVSISIPAGAAYDPKDKGGLATITAGLIDEGAGDLDSNAFKEALEDKAIRFGASADRDYMIISLTTLTENAPEAFRLLALALQHPRFDDNAFTRVRSQLIAAIQQDDEDPGNVAAKAWFAAYFGDHPYAAPTRGTPESLMHISLSDVRGFAAKYWTRGGAKISVAGDISEDQLKAYLQTALGPLSADTPPAAAKPAQEGAPGTRVLAAAIPQPAAVFGMPGPMRSDPDFIPTYVANYIFGGGGFSSRLMDAVREKRGLTYGIDTGINDFRSASILAGSVASDKAKILTALDVTKDEMARFARDGATPAELADAKTYLMGSFPLGFDSNGKIASLLNAFQRDGLPVDYVVRRNALIQAVTLADVNRVARRYFDPAKLTIVIAGTPEAVAAQGAPAAQPGGH